MVLACLLPTLATTLQAQAVSTPYPSRDVQIVVPNEPGGGLDLVARLLARDLGPRLNASFSVINRSGASGNVGTASVARAAPDGHTLLLTGVGHVASPLLHAQPGYDPLKDFVPVATVAMAPSVWMVHTSVTAAGVPQLLADPRSASGGMSFASAGFGHSSHLAAELVKDKARARWLHVPYRGTGPASRALVAGEVQMMFMPAGSVQSVLATGRARALAVASPHRLRSLPEVPTLAEQGMSDAAFSQWYALLAPTGTPPEVQQALHGAVRAILDEPGLRGQFAAMGLEPLSLGRDELRPFMASQQRQIEALLRRAAVQRPVD